MIYQFTGLTNGLNNIYLLPVLYEVMYEIINYLNCLLLLKPDKHSFNTIAHNVKVFFLLYDQERMEAHICL